MAEQANDQDKSKSQNDNGTFEDLRILDTDTPEEVKEKNEKAISFAQQNFEQRQKAEGKVKGADGKWTKPPKTEEKPAEQQEQQQQQQNQQPQLPTSDIIAISKANIHDEDLPEVLEYANFKKISVKDALSSSTVKAMLAEKQEERDVQAAMAGGKERRGTAKPSVDRILEDADKGNLPESDQEIRDLTIARRNRKHSKG